MSSGARHHAAAPALVLAWPAARLVPGGLCPLQVAAPLIPGLTRLSCRIAALKLRTQRTRSELRLRSRTVGRHVAPPPGPIVVPEGGGHRALTAGLIAAGVVVAPESPPVAASVSRGSDRCASR
jgi:hypothetical protein